MGRHLKVVAAFLLLLAISAVSAPSLRAQPAEVDANTAVQAVEALAKRMTDGAAEVGRHRFAPAYYAEPCQPTKEDGDRSLAEYRAQRRAFAAEVASLKAQIIDIEKFSSGAIVLESKGWKVHDQNRFRALDQAYRAYDNAITAKEAELDRMPVQPCRKAQPQPPQPPRDPNGPLTPGEERQFEDFPLATPTFDDPVTMPTPPKFCTFAERRAWMDSVYWPTVNRAQANALKAIEAFGKAEARLREVRNNDRPDSPRIALAEQSVRYWEAEKNRRMAEHQRLLAIDVPNPVDCGQPSTTAGTTGGTTTTTPPATTPTPPADGPAAAPPPPLPPGVVRPDLAQVTVPRLPARFCSEKEKLDFLVEIYHPAADAASKNALKTSAYRARLSQLIVEANERGDAQALAALKAEHDAFKPIADAADALAQRMYRMRAEILAIPVVDCSKPDQPTASAPPADDEPRLDTIIVEGTRIRGEPDDSRPAKPDLARPQFERVREFTIPANFCSAQERNDFLNNVYNPAVASALANARTAQAHQAKLNALFTEHMKANSLHWAAVRTERDAYEAITNEALAKSGALNDLYLKIMAVPITPCADTGDEADPVGEDPAPPSTPSGPKPPSTGMAPGGDPGFRDFPPFKYLYEFCSKEEAEAHLREVEVRLAEVREERERLETLVGVKISEQYALLIDNLMPEGWREGLTAEEMRIREAQHFTNAGKMALGRAAEGKSDAELAEYGRAFLAYERSGLEHLFAYDEEIRRLESARRRTLDVIASGRYDPCPKKPCPPKKGRDPITVGPNSKVGSGAQLRSKIGGMATGAVLGALGVGGGGGGGSEPRLWVCKIKDSEYTVFNDPLTGVSLRVGAKRAKGGKVIIFSEIAKSPDKGTFQTAFLERPSTGETLAPSDIGPCDLWGEWKLTVSWTKTTYVNGQMVDRQSGGWSEGGFFKIPGTLSQMDAPDGFWKQMGFSSAQMGAREMGMIFDLPPGGEPLTFVIHVTRPKGDPVTTVPFVLTMTEGPGGFTFTKAEDPPCPEVTMPVSDPAAPDMKLGMGWGGPSTTAPAPAAPSTAGSAGGDDEDPGDSDDRPSGPTPEQAYAIQRAETGAQEMVAAWRASDAELLTMIRDQRACDPTIRDRLLARFRERERMLEEGGGEIFDVAIRRAFELDGPRMNELKDLLGETACPATTPTTTPPAGNPGPAGTTPASGPPTTSTTPPPAGGGTPAPTGGPAGTPPGGSGAGATGSGTPDETPLPTSDLPRTRSGIETLRTLDLDARRSLEASRCKGPEEWSKRRKSYLSSLRARLRLFRRIAPGGRDAAAIQAAADAEMVRLVEEIAEIEAMEPPPPPTVCPPTEERDLDSILDEIEEVRVIA